MKMEFDGDEGVITLEYREMVILQTGKWIESCGVRIVMKDEAREQLRKKLGTSQKVTGDEQ